MAREIYSQSFMPEDLAKKPNRGFFGKLLESAASTIGNVMNAYRGSNYYSNAYTSTFDAIPVGSQQNVVGLYLENATRVLYDKDKVYLDYEAMDLYPEISSALDIYADEATQTDFYTKKVIWVETQNKEIAKIAQELFTNIEVEDILWSQTRAVAKFGELYERLIIRWDLNPSYNGEIKEVDNEDEKKRNIDELNPKYIGTIVGMKSVYGTDIEEVVNDDDNLMGFTIRGASQQFAPWSHIKFAMHTRARKTGMRTMSMIEPARFQWKQLKMLEESLIVYRLQKGPDRYVFYLDVGNSSPEDAYELTNKFKNRFKNSISIDPNAGLTSNFNPASIDDDIFWPIAKDNNSRVEKLSGSGNVADIADIEYQQKKLFGAIKVPPPFLGGNDTGSWSAASTLSQQDIRFGRSVARLQKVMINGYTRLLYLACKLKGMVLVNPSDFTIRMCPINSLDSLQRASLVNEISSSVASLVSAISDMKNNGITNVPEHIFTKMYSLDKDFVAAILADLKKEEEPQGDDYGGESEQLNLGPSIDLNSNLSESDLKQLASSLKNNNPQLASVLIEALLDFSQDFVVSGDLKINNDEYPTITALNAGPSSLEVKSG